MARVVVVGAGMAGLTAALRLGQAGHDVTVLEAQNRLGGRVRSITLSNGEVAELGGEWIRSDQRWIVALAREVGVQMTSVRVDFAERDLIGSPAISPVEHRRVAGIVTFAIERLQSEELAALTAEELLADLDDASDAFMVLRQRLEGSAAVSARSVAVTEITGDFGVGEATYVRVDGGNQALAHAVAARLSDVRMEQPVEAVESTDSTVSVFTANETIAADAVVVAVPLPIVSRLRFDPPLPRALTVAFERLAMGTASKIAIPTESHPPLLARQSGDATWWCWTGAGEDGLARRAVTAFAGTRDAVRATSDDWPSQLAEAIPEVSLATDSVVVDWGNEEWFGGCYTALGPGDETLLGAFALKGRVRFAGEHTLASGSIDSAIESGERAASRLESFLSGLTAPP